VPIKLTHEVGDRGYSMARKPVLFSSLVKPLKAWWQKTFFAVGIAACILFVIMDRGGVDHVKEIRINLTDAVLPITQTISHPIKSISNFVDDFKNLNQAREVVKVLEAQVRDLQEELIVTQGLMIQNRRLKEQTNFVDFPDTKIITGRVVTHSGGPFLKSMLINIGEDNGARLGQAVISEYGLVGVIVEVTSSFARVLQITDINSQIPVVTENTRDPAIIKGDNSRFLKLKFIPNDSLLAVGDRIVTSGHGGLLPPDIPIGHIAEIDGTSVLVSSLVDWDRLDYIRVLDYRFADDLSQYLNNSSD
tara:strand:+ start:206 stop:1120 length:915 start_codon:yes stop_codon:yes gene_type:complete